jgi:hypothetical protein
VVRQYRHCDETLSRGGWRPGGADFDAGGAIGRVPHRSARTGGPSLASSRWSAVQRPLVPIVGELTSATGQHISFHIGKYGIIRGCYRGKLWRS